MLDASTIPFEQSLYWSLFAFVLYPGLLKTKRAVKTKSCRQSEKASACIILVVFCQILGSIRSNLGDNFLHFQILEIGLGLNYSIRVTTILDTTGCDYFSLYTNFAYPLW